MNSPKSSRIEWLDSIRGLAALSVVFSHYILAYGFPTDSSLAKKILTNSPLHIWWDGFAAVSLFFVLSGFVLSKRFFEENLNFDYIKNYPQYLFQRIFRIWPPYLICFALSLIFIKINNFPLPTRLHASPWIQNYWINLPSLQRIFHEATLLISVETYLIIPQAWTLRSELILSLFVPLFALFAKRNSFLTFSLICFGILVIKIPIYSFHFMIGILLAKNSSKIAELKWPFLNLALLISGLTFYTFRFTLPEYFPNLIPEQRIFYITGIGSALLILYCLRSSAVQVFLKKPSLIFLGKISYSVYLLHFSILIWFVPKLLYLTQRVGFSPYVNWYVGILSLATLTIVLSKFFYSLIEIPSIKFGKKIFPRSKP